jgi:ABC-type enterobactin transport system permease subunit
MSLDVTTALHARLRDAFEAEAQSHEQRSNRLSWLRLATFVAGAVLLTAADLVSRMLPTEQELKLGVVTALFGAPVFALVAWRAARSWRT